MIIYHILAATLLAGALSVGVAALMTFHWLGTLVARLVPLSAGLLLATSLLHLIPEVLESGMNGHSLGTTLLCGILGLFLLERFSVVRHDHHHEQDGHDHPHGHDRKAAGRAGLTILLGDAVHNFADGLIIAAAFMVDAYVGWFTALAIAAHEVPQEVGDFIILLNAGHSRRRALIYNVLSGMSAVAGGIVGYFALGVASAIHPYVLTVAAASFIYIALSDLVPQMHADLNGERSQQMLLLATGIGLVVLMSTFMHRHGAV